MAQPLKSILKKTTYDFTNDSIVNIKPELEEKVAVAPTVKKSQRGYLAITIESEQYAQFKDKLNIFRPVAIHLIAVIIYVCCFGVTETTADEKEMDLVGFICHKWNSASNIFSYLNLTYICSALLVVNFVYHLSKYLYCFYQQGSVSLTPLKHTLVFSLVLQTILGCVIAYNVPSTFITSPNYVKKCSSLIYALIFCIYLGICDFLLSELSANN